MAKDRLKSGFCNINLLILLQKFHKPTGRAAQDKIA
jgi:hypothetical protein